MGTAFGIDDKKLGPMYPSKVQMMALGNVSGGFSPFA